jgi:outer membrane immunogenic protein
MRWIEAGPWGLRAGAASAIAVATLVGPTLVATGAQAGDTGRGIGPGFEYTPAMPDPQIQREPASRPNAAPLFLGGLNGPRLAMDGPDWWSGFYLGGTLGYGSGRTSVDGDSGRFSHDQSGGMLGLLGGYNWRRQGIVFGLEGEAKAARISGSATVVGRDLEQSTRWMGTARGRAGVLLAPALLVYGLAGVSVADIKLKGGVLGGAKTDDIFLGLQVGGGAEVKLTEQWSLRAEYTSNSFDPSIHAIQAGIVYRF